MSSMLGHPQADTDMASSFDFEYTSAMASEATGDDFDIDLTYEEHAQPFDAVMDDGEVDEGHHESEMLDGNDLALDEPMNENTEQFVELDYIEDEVIATTPKPDSIQISAAPDISAVHTEQMLDGSISQSLNEVKDIFDHTTGDGLSYTHDDTKRDTTAYQEPYQQAADQAIDFGDEEEAIHVFGDDYDAGIAGSGEYHEAGEEEEVVGHYEENHAEEEEDPFATAAETDFFEATEQAGPTENVKDEHQEQDSEDQESPESFMYQCNIQWQEFTVPLFKRPSVGSGFFSDDVSLAQKDFSAFFKATREILKSQVGDDDILELQVPQLDLKIDENSYDCADSSLVQMLELYHRLQANDGIENPETLNIVLSSTLRYSARINQLFEAAEANKGYAAVLNYHEDVDEEAHGDENSVEHAEQEVTEDGDDVEGEQEFAGQNDTNGDVTAEVAEDENHGEEQHDATEPNQDGEEALDQTVYEEAREQQPQTTDELAPVPQISTDVLPRKKSISANTKAPAGFSPVLGENDEIDYEDDQPVSKDGNQESTFTDPSAQPTADLDQHAEDATTHEEFVIDFGTSDDAPAATDLSNNNIPTQTSTVGVTEVASTSNTGTLTAEEEFELELERSFSDEALSTSSDKGKQPALEHNGSTEEDDEIDWDDEEEAQHAAVAPKASAGVGSSPSTPLGKRGREVDQSEEEAEVDSGQEVKRVKA